MATDSDGTEEEEKKKSVNSDNKTFDLDLKDQLGKKSYINVYCGIFNNTWDVQLLNESSFEDDHPDFVQLIYGKRRLYFSSPHKL